MILLSLVLREGTNRSRTRIWYPPFIFYPSVVRTLLVSVGSIKNSPDVRHAVHTHCRTTEDGAGSRE